MKSKRLIGALAAGAALAAAAPTGASAAVQVGSSGWSWGNPLPQGNTIRSMSFAGTTGFAAGDFGTLLKTVDGGATWSGLPVGTFQSLSLVQAVSPTTVIAGGGCVARRSDDGGVTFTRIPFTGRESKCAQPLAGFSFVTPQTGWLVLADGTVLQTNNGGTEFIQRTAVPGTQAAGGNAQPTDIAFVSATVGYAISSQGKIFQTSDAGQAWKVVYDGQRKVNDLTFVDPLNGFAVGDGGLFIKTVDGGATWTPKDVGAGAQNLTSIRCANTVLCLAATAKGDQLVRTADGGETAGQLLSPSTDAIYAAAFASPTQVAAAGARGSSVVSVDGGLNFTAVGGRLSGKYFGIRAGGTAGSAFAPGDNGALARTTDGGATWTRGNVTTSEDVRDVSFPTPQVGYALDTSGEVFKTTSGGDAWSTLNTGTTAVANAIFAPNADTVLTIGGRGIRRSAKGGDFVQVKGAAVARTPLTAVDRAGSAIVAYGAQDLIRSTDAGATWSTVLKPGKYVKRGKKRVNTLRIKAADFTTAKQGWLLDGSGRVWKTANGGKSWTPSTSVGTEDAYGMAFSSATSGYLVVGAFGDTSGGFLLRTTDGGTTWHPQFVVNDPISSFGVASPGGGTDYLLGGDSGLLASKTGGDAGAAATLAITTKTKTPKKAQRITVTGKLAPGTAQERVTVSYQQPGSTNWTHQTVNTASDGGFTTSWAVYKGDNRFVAQWAGNFKARGAGSKVLTVTVGKKQKKK